MNTGYNEIALDQIETQLNNLGSKSLVKLQQMVANKIMHVRAAEQKEARDKIFAIANAIGKTPREILGTFSDNPKPSVPIKYRDPANSNNTWTGRGPRPKWVRDYLEARDPSSLEQLLIQE